MAPLWSHLQNEEKEKKTSKYQTNKNDWTTINTEPLFKYMYSAYTFYITPLIYFFSSK